MNNEGLYEDVIDSIKGSLDQDLQLKDLTQGTLNAQRKEIKDKKILQLKF